MTTELVLLVAVYALILMGVFFNKDIGPMATFKKSGPRLGAKIERDIAIGSQFKNPKTRWESK